jgi:hypothetical protein
MTVVECYVPCGAEGASMLIGILGLALWLAGLVTTLSPVEWSIFEEPADRFGRPWWEGALMGTLLGSAVFNVLLDIARG